VNGDKIISYISKAIHHARHHADRRGSRCEIERERGASLEDLLPDLIQDLVQDLVQDLEASGNLMAMAKNKMTTTTTAMADSSILAAGLLFLVILGSGDRHGGIQKSEAARGIPDRSIWKPTASLLSHRRSLGLNNGLGATPPMGCVSPLTRILHRFQFFFEN
jgi:hypothetical protein